MRLVKILPLAAVLLAGCATQSTEESTGKEISNGVLVVKICDIPQLLIVDGRAYIREEMLEKGSGMDGVNASHLELSLAYPNIHKCGKSI